MAIEINKANWNQPKKDLALVIKQSKYPAQVCSQKALLEPQSLIDRCIKGHPRKSKPRYDEPRTIQCRLVKYPLVSKHRIQWRSKSNRPSVWSGRKFCLSSRLISEFQPTKSKGSHESGEHRFEPMQKPDRLVANNPQEFDPKLFATRKQQWRVIKGISVVNKISYIKNQLYTGKSELW